MPGELKTRVVQTKDFLIKVHDKNGNYLRAFYTPFEKRKLNEEDRGRLPDDITPPDEWPALKSIYVDDEGRLWVSTYVENRDINEWWVLSETGQPLATYTWPANKGIDVVKNGYLYTRETSEETGVESVVRYQVFLQETPI